MFFLSGPLNSFKTAWARQKRIEDTIDLILKNTTKFLSILDKETHVLTRFDVDISCQNLMGQIKMTSPRPEMVRAAEKTLETVKGIWKPCAVYRWVEFEQTGTPTIGRIVHGPDRYMDLDFGCSAQFLTQASHCLVCVYTAGRELEQESIKASSTANLLGAYFIDNISLMVLDCVGRTVNTMVEKLAGSLGWGVSPFLSPGSVNGWDLQEQKKLCSILPLEKINVTIENDTILSPFKSISGLVGIGPG